MWLVFFIGGDAGNQAFVRKKPDQRLLEREDGELIRHAR